MHVNLDNLFSLPYVHNLTFLLIIKHAAKKDVSEYLIKAGCTLGNLEDLKNQGYVKFIKGKAKQSGFQKVRLDKKGTEYLKNLDEPMVEEQDIQIFEWLSGIYKGRGKEIGNGKKTKMLIAAFREKTGIEKNHLAFLCKSFIDDENKQKWSYRLEYVFWKPANVFQTKFTLEDSKLWRYYSENKQFFDTQFKTIKNG